MNTKFLAAFLLLISSAAIHNMEEECEIKPISTQPVIELVQNLWQYNGTPALEKQRKAILNKIKKASKEELDTQNPHGWTALHFAVSAQDISMTTLLLQHKANPNITTNGSQSTPLHILLHLMSRKPFEGEQAFVDLLLHHKADPSLTNKNGKRPFDYLKTKEKPGKKKRPRKLRGKGEEI